MRKVLPVLGIACSALALVWAAPSKAQDQKKFQDVPDTHWAYQAVTDLQSKGILLGYPDGYFRGKRTLTRYEFAVALERALNSIMPNGGTGQQGPPGADGAPGPAGPPGMTPEEIAEMKRLMDEFKNELASLGANVRDMNNRLDQLSKDVADLKDRFNHMIQFNGDFFAGFTSGRSRFGFLDYSGAFRAPSNSLFENVSAPHDFHLTANANLRGGVKFTGDLFSSNYLSYASQGFTGNGVALGGSNGAATGPLGEQIGLDQAQIEIPLTMLGGGTTLTVGRFKNKVTPLTYWRPDTDAYFNLPWYNDGKFVQDGFKLQSHFGSVRTKLWAGSYNSLTTSDGAAGTVLNAPMVGAAGLAAGFGTRVQSTFKPFGYNPGADLDAVAAQQSVGLHVALPLFHTADLGFTVEDFSAGAAGSNGIFGNVAVYGANLNLDHTGPLHISAEAAKSVTAQDISTGDGQSNDDNNAYKLNVGYRSHHLNAALGYQYIDPRFGAPGYWDKIGNWYNPTNIAGPYVKLGYDFTHALSGYIGGDFYTGARNRSTGGGGFDIGSSLTRASAGVKFTVSRMLNLRADYEGVFWNLDANSSASGASSKPVEQYLTLGTGVNLASNTVLKMAYQIISLRDNGGGFGGVLGGSPGDTSNASVFTTQIAVHF